MAVPGKKQVDHNIVEYMVCVTTPLPDIPMKTAACARCGVTVYYSSRIPVDVPKVCERCASELLQERQQGS
jgi:hypothetical protein